MQKQYCGHCGGTLKDAGFVDFLKAKPKDKPKAKTALDILKALGDSLDKLTNLETHVDNEKIMVTSKPGIGKITFSIRDDKTFRVIFSAPHDLINILGDKGVSRNTLHSNDYVETLKSLPSFTFSIENNEALATVKEAMAQLNELSGAAAKLPKTAGKSLTFTKWVKYF